MFQQKLAALMKATAGGEGQPPLPREIVVAELDPNAFDREGRPSIELDALRSPDEYEARFVALMSRGYSWLNLSFYGFIDGKGLVVVELPKSETQTAGASTSVNLSGPPAVAAESGWDARSHVTLR